MHHVMRPVRHNFDKVGDAFTVHDFTCPVVMTTSTACWKAVAEPDISKHTWGPWPPVSSYQPDKAQGIAYHTHARPDAYAALHPP